MCETEKIPERTKIYLDYQKEIHVRQNYNTDKFDSAILSLSSGLLAVSVSFIKDVVNISEANGTCLLIMSWCLFGFSILLTMASFAISNVALRVGLEHARLYYMEQKDEYLSKENRWGTSTEIVNIFAGSSFGLAIIFTIIFVSINLGGK